MIDVGEMAVIFTRSYFAHTIVMSNCRTWRDGDKEIDNYSGFLKTRLDFYLKLKSPMQSNKYVGAGQELIEK